MRCITEWQLDHRLGLALQQGFAADTRLFLAMLSKYVDEQAPFVPRYPSTTPIETDLYQQLSVRRSRSFAMTAQDPYLMRHHSDALHQREQAPKLSQDELSPVTPTTLHADQQLGARQFLQPTQHATSPHANTAHTTTVQWLPKHAMSYPASLIDLKLQLLLNPPPTVVQDNRQKITADVTESLDAWTLARQASNASESRERDHTLLFDVLEEVHHTVPVIDPLDNAA
jgi:hypothetical protein